MRWLANLKHIFGLNRAIGFTVMARGWSTVAGVVTVLLIGRYLTAAEQGYYYTFSSLVALQIIFELGLSFVILQLAAHECAHLTVASDGGITGNPVAHSRLASILQKAVRWYSCGAVLLVCTLLPIGFRFFGAHSSPGAAAIHWRGPWILAVLATTVTFQLDPIFSFIEGSGRVPQVARMRFTQAVLGSLLAWGALGIHHGLFAPSMTIVGQAIAGILFLVHQRRLLLPLLGHSTRTNFVSWRREIWPFQWRISISWLSGYFIFQLFNPVLFAARGPAEAGRMGMSLSIASTLSAVALAWMNTKAAPFGTLVARREFDTLDRLFFRTLVQSLVLLSFGATALVFGLWYFERALPVYAGRVLPVFVFGVLMATVLCNHVVFCEAIYLRAHKREPFLPVSVAVGILTAASTILLGRTYGAAGMTYGYFCINGLFGLALGSTIFLRMRNRWHQGPVEKGVAI